MFLGKLKFIIHLVGHVLTIVATVKEIVKMACFKVTEIYRVMLDALYQKMLKV